MANRKSEIGNLFTGTIDWDRLAAILAASAYEGPVSMEVVIHNTGIEDEQAFLAAARAAGEQLTDNITAIRAIAE